jgi:hypothetical protein
MNETSWKGLLANALAVLDDLDAIGFGTPEFSLGGGTVLMLRYRHRLSRDIDIFLHDAQWLTLLTPRLNDAVAARVRDYSEQANSLKLVFAEGDVDFIVASSVTSEPPSEMLAFQGLKIPMDASAEILAKKLYFRAALLKPRDAFDLVAIHECDPAAASSAIAASAPRRADQLRRLKALQKLPTATLEKDITVLGDFGRVFQSLFATAIALIEAAA